MHDSIYVAIQSLHLRWYPECLHPRWGPQCLHPRWGPQCLHPRWGPQFSTYAGVHSVSTHASIQSVSTSAGVQVEMMKEGTVNALIVKDCAFMHDSIVFPGMYTSVRFGSKKGLTTLIFPSALLKFIWIYVQVTLFG